VSGSFSPISAAAFSPSRPLVFAATSSDGFLYVYDLSANPLVPVATLECPLQPPVSTEDATAAAAQGSSRAHKKAPTKRGGGAESAHNRVTTTGLAFNPKQRGLVAVCDYLGRVHIWKLSWRLSNMRADEQAGLDAIASIYATPEPQATTDA
jgi:WD40 repeat protein